LSLLEKDGGETAIEGGPPIDILRARGDQRRESSDLADMMTIRMKGRGSFV
jgi:hypothetical protein